MLNTDYTNNTNGNEWQIQKFDITFRQQVITLRGENDEFGGGKWSFWGREMVNWEAEEGRFYVAALL